MNEKTPVVGIISRLADQKGFDLIGEVLDDLMKLDLQIVILGTGEKKYHDLFEKAQKKFPGKIAAALTFDNELAHLIEAGSDMFLMPSRYEPCGLNQMYSLRYGTVPIVHKTGGLADTVQLWDPRDRTGTGIVFDHFDAAGLHWAIDAALAQYRDRSAWNQLVENGMAMNFSWDAQGKLYEELYRRLTAR